MEMDGQIMAKLEPEGMKRGLSLRLLAFYRSLGRIQAKAGERIGIPEVRIDSIIARARIEAGLPLLRFDELEFDFSLLQHTFAQVAIAFGNYPDLFGELPESLKVKEANPSLSQEMAKAWFERSKGPITTGLSEPRGDPIIQAIIQAAFHPFLVAQAKVLLGLVNQERWRRNYCPICGGKPDFAFLDREGGARWLLCFRCDSEWLFQRLQCPYCRSQNQNDLACYIDPEGIYRLYICEQCHTYIKAIDLRLTKESLSLPLERILTLNMDQQAQENGYRAGHLFGDLTGDSKEGFAQEMVRR
jgi:formate dehydrogenase maturation protein FdhE